MKYVVIIAVLSLSIIILIIRAFFPIPIDKPSEIISGINLMVDVLCGSFIVSITTYLLTSVIPFKKRQRTAKTLIKYKIAELNLLKWTPGDVNGNHKETFEEFMKEFNYDLKMNFVPLEIRNNSGFGIISIWTEDLFRNFSEISLFMDYLDISFLQKLETIKNNDIFWQINSIKYLYDNSVNIELINNHSLSLIKDLDKLNTYIKSLEKDL